MYAFYNAPILAYIMVENIFYIHIYIHSIGRGIFVFIGIQTHGSLFYDVDMMTSGRISFVVVVFVFVVVDVDVTCT
jgi:hypothetical protein